MTLLFMYGIIFIILLIIISESIHDKQNNNIPDGTTTPTIIRTQCKNCNHLFKYKTTEKPEYCPWCGSEL